MFIYSFNSIVPLLSFKTFSDTISCTKLFNTCLTFERRDLKPKYVEADLIKSSFEDEYCSFNV